MTTSSVKVQISPESVPSTPSWFGEVTLIAHVFTQRGLLSEIRERVRFARAKFGIYDTIDFVVVLLGYAISGERTLEEFYERLAPFGKAFMSLFGRVRLPSRSALSNYLAALDQGVVEALRTLFLEDLGACRELAQGGLYDREGTRWVVIDVDATRQAARQRALPHGLDLPSAHRRMDAVCAPGYLGRKRGEVVRSRTTVLQAHMQSWLGTFGEAGNGDYRGELLRAIEAITALSQAWSIPLSRILIRLDGLYGNVALLIDLLTSGLGVVVRGRDYSFLDLPSVQTRLALPPDAWTTHPESGVQRALYDCPGIPLDPTGRVIRMIVAVHQESMTKAPIGVTRNGLVYEIFFTSAPNEAFTPVDVLHLYLHRGAFETVLAHEDQEQDPDRWVSRTHWGQECWQILSQWIWNMRLELGQHLEPTHLRLTELLPEGVTTEPDASALLEALASHAEAVSAPTNALEKVLPPVGYGPPVFSARSGRLGFAGTAFVLQPNGTLHCPNGKPLYPQERTREASGSLRMVFAARISDCRVCPIRSACQGAGKSPRSPRRVSAVCQPLVVEGSARVLDASVDAPTLSRESGLTPPALRDADSQVSPPPMSAPKKRTLPTGYGPPVFSARSAHAGFAGTDFSLQPDGTLLCPTNHSLSLLELRPLESGPIRIVYAARISNCRDCPLRSACQGLGNTAVRARRVHALCHPLPVDPSPLADGNVQTPSEPASSPIHIAPEEIKPGVPPAGVNVQAPSEPASSPIHIAPEEIKPGVPPAGVNVQAPSEPASSPIHIAPEEIKPGVPPAGVNVQAPSEPASSPIHIAPEEIKPGVPPAGVNVQAPSEPASSPIHIAPEEIKPGVPPAGVNVQAPSEPASSPIHIAPEEIKPGVPPAGVNVQAPSEPASSPIHIAPEEIKPGVPPAGVNVQAPSEPPSSPVQAASGETASSPPPTASGPDAASLRPILWEDWPAFRIRQQWLKRLRTETVHLTIGPLAEPSPEPSPLVLTRAQRAHWRLSWKERFARNARREAAPVISITLHGIPASFARMFALDIAA